jgi:hypothetical protein
MPDHDMSDQACQERAKRYQEHEKLKEQVAELFQRTEAILNVLAILASHIEGDDPLLKELKQVLGMLKTDPHDT